MEPVKSGVATGSDRDVLLLFGSIAGGAVASVLVKDALGEGLGEALGFFVVWVALYSYARRRWAADLPASRYWTTAVMGTAIAAALRLLLA